MTDSVSVLGESCNSSGNCSTGQCCDADKKCKTDCEVESGAKSGWRLAV